AGAYLAALVGDAHHPGAAARAAQQELGREGEAACLGAAVNLVRPGRVPSQWPARPSVPSVTRVDERGDREPVVGGADLLALVIVPALLAREARARKRGLGCMFELHVDHDDRRRERQLVLVLDHVRALEGILPVAT